MRRLRQLPALLALLLPCWEIQAADPTWSFTYTGLLIGEKSPYFGQSSQFHPDLQMTGSFSGKDLDWDGVIEAGELSSFKVWGGEWLPCVSNVSGSFVCELERFDYSPGATLNFSLTRTEVVGEESTDYITVWHFDSVRGYHQNRKSNVGWIDDWDYRAEITPQTILNISAPVPEPASWQMAALGTALLGALLGRRCRQTAHSTAQACAAV